MSGGKSVSLGELLPAVSPEHAEVFLRDWMSEPGVPGWVVLTRISSAGRHIVKSWGFEVPELLGMVTRGESFEALCSDEGGTWNVYVSCSTHKENPCAGSTGGAGRRGGRHTVAGMHGVWLDLDVKNESFRSGDDIDAFLEELPVRPSLVVGSGSGGRHAYWRFTEGSLTVEDGERVAEAWWALAQEVAGSVYIDKLTSADRIMRLPGTVRWPKTVGESPGSVQVLRRGDRASIARIWDPSVASFERLRERRARVRERVKESGNHDSPRLQQLARNAGWPRLYLLAHIEQLFNERVGWEEILTPYGWRFVGSDHEGRRHWARPGQRGKSAHTDYPASPGVMNLFSNSADTGLAALKDADVVLTKFRVYAQLKYNGDTGALVEAILDHTDGIGRMSEDDDAVEDER